MKRVFLIVLDSFGIGEMPDAEAYGDINVNTLRSVSKSPYFHMEHMRDMGLFQIDGVSVGEKTEHPTAAYARMTERSRGKDTTIGHWEIAGIYSPKPLPTYPNGFPEEVLEEFRLRTGRDILCNKPYSGTQVIADYGDEHVRTGKLIVYTSADSVFQIAAHEDVVPVDSYTIIVVLPDRYYRENTAWVVSLPDLLQVRADITPVLPGDMISLCCRPQLPCWIS